MKGMMYQIMTSGRLFFLMCIGSVMSLSANAEPSPVVREATNSGTVFQQNNQNRISNVKGKVTDSKGEGLPGVTIRIKNQTTGTISDAMGNFDLSIPSGPITLVFSYVGYVTQEVLVNSSTINVKLLETTIGISEVVVVGYGIQKKESVVGAISQVKDEALMNSGVKTITNALSGLVPGLVTQQNSGQPGKDQANIFIRGRSTWQSSNPLVLVDGIERDMNDIDPNEIQDISVLKDASATAVYGTRGGNGVILVTTKRGADKKPQMTFSFNQGFKTPTGRNTYVDSYNTLQYANEAMKNDNNWKTLTSAADLEKYRSQSDPLFYPSINWAKEMIKPVAFQTDVNFNVSGGTKNLKHFSSIGYLYDDDLLNTKKTDKFEPRYFSNRLNLRSNLDYEATPTTRLSLNFGAIFKRTNVIATNVYSLWRGIYLLPPNDSPLYYEPEVLEKYPDPYEPNASGYRYVWGSGKYGSIMNPITVANTGGSGRSEAGFFRSDYNTVNVDFRVEQKLDVLLKGLIFSGQVSYNTATEYSNSYKTVVPFYRLRPNGTWERKPDYGGDTDLLTPLNYSGTSLVTNTQRLYFETKLNYSIKREDHDLTALLLSKGSVRSHISGTAVNEPYKELDFAGRVTYNYDLRYLFEMNIGYSGSEQFAPANRFGLFPAFALGWNIAQENFIKNSSLSVINNLKTRFSWGKTGTSAGARWLYYPVPWTAGTSYGFGGLGGSISTWNLPGAAYTPGAIENANAQWEESIKKNIGLELGISENKYTLTVDVYDEFRNNILMPPTALIPAWGGFTGKDRNIGQTKNHGIEVEFMYNKRVNRNFRFYAGAYFSFNENRVVFRGDAPGTPIHQQAQGKPINYTSQLLRDGLFESVDDINNYLLPSGAMQVIPGDVKFIDYNADGQIDGNDKVPVEYQQYPRYDYSIKSGLTYKQFNLGFILQGNAGKVMVNYGPHTPFGITATGIPRIETFHFDRYTPETPNSPNHVFHFSGDVLKSNNYYTAAGYDQQLSINSNYFRIKQVNLSYRIDTKYLKKYQITELLLFANGNNLFTFSPLKQKFVDPEKPTFLAGQGEYDYPMQRRINLGMKLNF
jgi:TonB-linked SusC/RagA family outer membrane protein